LEANGSRGGANKAKQTEERTFPTKTKGVVDEVNLLCLGTRKDFTELIIKNGADKVHIYYAPNHFKRRWASVSAKVTKLLLQVQR
jgi:hypothetical protein